MNIAELLDEVTTAHGDTVAISDLRSQRRRDLTFAQLGDKAAAASATFRLCGLEPGDGVLVLHSMSPDLYAAIAGILRAGLVALFPDPSAPLRSIERCTTAFSPSAVIYEPRAHVMRALSKSLWQIPLRFAMGRSFPGTIRLDSNSSGVGRLESLPDESPALITLTSGSTGAPKIAMRTHGFLAAQNRALAANFERADGPDLTTLPVFVLANLSAGVTSIIPDTDLRHPGAIDPERIARAIDDERVESLSGSPAMFARVVDHCRAAGRRLETLKHVFVGGGPVWPRLADTLETIAPNSRVHIVYGSTEAEPISHLAWDELEASERQAIANGAGLPVGRPIPDVDLRIIADTPGIPLGPFTAAGFRRAGLPAGTPGEIVVSGNHVLPGHLHGQGDVETKFRVDGRPWHRTGDIGYLDHGGQLWLLGRSGTVVRDQHGTLYPLAVEAALSGLPDLGRLAVVAHRDKRIVVVEGDGLESHPLLVDRVPWAKINEVRVVDAIPTDARHNSKTDYGALRRLLG